MIFKFIQSVTQAAGRSEIVEQGAREERKTRSEAKLVDVAHETFRRDRDDLEGLVRIGWPNVQRERIAGKVRKKVWDLVQGSFGVADEEMVEEITERMVDAAEHDPYYKQMFADDEPETA
jgi:hypothetical protein